MNPRRLAWSLWAAAVALTAGFVVLVVLDAPSPGPLSFAEEWPITAVYVLLTLTFPTIGLLIATRQPRNAIGWMFCAAGMAMAAGMGSILYADYGTYLRPDLPGASHAAHGNQLFVVGLALATVFLLFLFPTGRPLTAWWRRIFVALAATFGAGLVAGVLAPGPVEPFEEISNPLGLSGFPGAAAAFVSESLELAAPLMFALGVWALVVRFRRSRGNERQQMKWFAYAAALMSGTLAVGFSMSALGLQLASDIAWLAALAALVFLPVSVGLAIIRYRLYDIDRIVSRTLSYLLVSAVLAGVYFGVALLPVVVLGREGSAPDVWVAAGTLASAALFRPVRRHVQAGVDRRFNRSRYDAEKTISAFSARLRDEVDLDLLGSEIAEVVRLAMQPSHVAVWTPRGTERPPGVSS